MADSYWGSDKGIQEQKDFEASLPKPWKRVLESYRTFGGEQFQMHTGDNFDFRKYENDVETQAMKLYYDWDSHKPKWRLMVGKKYETKDGKITSVLEYDEHMLKEFEEAKSKTVCIFRSKSAGSSEQTGHRHGLNRPPSRSKSATPCPVPTPGRLVG